MQQRQEERLVLTAARQTHLANFERLQSPREREDVRGSVLQRLLEALDLPSQIDAHSRSLRAIRHRAQDQKLRVQLFRIAGTLRLVPQDNHPLSRQVPDPDLQ